ncbi:MAG: efflux RND transporter permease subunit, partial [Bacteroidota bacterium]
MNIPKLAIKNYQFVIAAFVMLAAWALINFTTVPRTEFPIVDSPMVTVHAILMGSNVENMEVHVLTPLEAGLQALGDIKDLRSKISGHVISINIAFNYGVDIDEKLNKTQGLLSGMRRTLPKELIELSAHKASTNFAAVLQLALLPKSISYAQLEKEAKKIQKSIRQVSGVQSVHLEGYPRREVQIQLDLEKMHSYQINFNQVEAILQRNNVYLPAGDIDLTTKHYNIITSGVFQDIEKLRTTFIKMEEGQFLQLQDIASVDIRYEKEQWISRYKGQESLIIYVKQDE